MTDIPQVARQLAESVDAGRFIELGHTLRQGMPHHPAHPPFIFGLMRQHNDVVVECYSSANDVFTMGGHTGTHLDALGHVSDDNVMHGDLDAEEHQDVREGLTAYDIARQVPVIAPGVLLDVAGFTGERHLPAEYAVTKEDLQATCDHQGTMIERGDVVLVRTGWTKVFNERPREYSAPSVDSPPGVDLGGAEWLVEQGIRATGADTAPYEIRRPGLPVHRFLLVRSGVPIMENLNLEDAAEQRAHRFLFVAVPLRIAGGTGSPIRPVAVL